MKVLSLTEVLPSTALRGDPPQKVLMRGISFSSSFAASGSHVEFLTIAEDLSLIHI